MKGKTQALCHGAATIVNAIALGKGAAFGVDLWTKAEVELVGEVGVVEGEIASDPSVSAILIEKAALQVLRHFGTEKIWGAKVKTWSNIPIARGLKSSSVAANAVVLATTAALGKQLDDLSIINLGVNAAFDAEVTVTGAFDDACAAYFGGVVVTDNIQRKILQQSALEDDVAVLFLVPSAKAYTINSDVERMKAVKPLVEIAHEEALKKNFWTALTLNGLVYSAALGLDTSIAIDALNAGAFAAGLCGKGPAVTAIVPKDKVDSVEAVWQNYQGKIFRAQLNNSKAKVL